MLKLFSLILIIFEKDLNRTSFPMLSQDILCIRFCVFFLLFLDILIDRNLVAIHICNSQARLGDTHLLNPVRSNGAIS